MKFKKYKSKYILNVHKYCDGGWFWAKYTAFPYSGCQWGCEYCYWRDEKYNPHKLSPKSELTGLEDPFSQYIKIKEGAPQMLEKALKNKPKDLIYLDNYQPIDSKYLYCQQMLEVCLKLKFPVFINEKSSMLLRDLDLLKKINQSTYLNVGWSIITSQDDDTKLSFEPKSPTIKSRFKAMKILSESGIDTGTALMPVLPFIYDTPENIEAVVAKTKENGGTYILEGGLTLQRYCRTHFYKALNKFNPKLIKKYDHLYQNKKAYDKYIADVHNLVLKYCRKYDLTPYIPQQISFFPKKIQLNRKISGDFYLKSRELMILAKEKYKAWAYLKAARTLEDLEENIETIYSSEGINGLIALENIGQSIAEQIESYLKNKSK